MILIDDVLLIGFILLIIGSVTAVILKVQPVKIIFWGLVFAYGIIVLGLTLFPIPYEINEGMVSVPHNFIPFRSICSILKMGITRTAIVQLCGNIIISVPYGVILTTVKQKKDILFYVGLPFIFPIIIEGLQFIIGQIIGFSYRTFDVDDFLLNILGVYFGIAFSTLLLKRILRMLSLKLHEKNNGLSLRLNKLKISLWRCLK